MAVVLTGPPGAGKSSVLDSLATMLEIEGFEFGALESEQLGWGSPWLYGEPWLRQLSAVLELQRQARRRRSLVVATTETTEELAAVVEAIAVDHVVTVLLDAPPELVAARIDAREPDVWPVKQRLIDHARHVAVSMRALDGIDIRIDTSERTARDVAAELRETLRRYGWTVSAQPKEADPGSPLAVTRTSTHRFRPARRGSRTCRPRRKS